jgi:hypothetical protein
MGIDVNGAKFLLYAKSVGVDFGTTGMIGRQGLYVAPAEMQALIHSFGGCASEAVLAEVYDGAAGYSEGLLRHLGARQTHSFDFSDFESATFTHDMNQPIEERFKEQYSVILDGGTLEHVFNFPVAIKSSMEMVKIGGHYMAITPANNFFGHGFYQFSPELYFTIMSPENGFRIQRVIAFEEVAQPVWYAVRSPQEVKGRVTLMNSHPVHLLIIAQRTERVAIFNRTPQQSDYVGRWSNTVGASPESASQPAPRPLAIRVAKALVPARVRRSIRAALSRPVRPLQGFDPRFFQPFDPTKGAAL